MAISLTESAANRVKTFLAARGHGLGLRLGVRKTGCSGFAYVINYADDAAARATWCSRTGACKVFVDPDSLPLIDGTMVDFVKQGLNEAFRFRNPTSRASAAAGRASPSERRGATAARPLAGARKCLTDGHFRASKLPSATLAR